MKSTSINGMSTLEYWEKHQPSSFILHQRILGPSEVIRYCSPTFRDFLSKTIQLCIDQTQDLNKKYFSIKAQDLRFQLIETSHSSPIGQLTTGWGKPHIKEIGWEGKIEIEVNDYTSSHGDIFDHIILNTGSGGYRKSTDRGHTLVYDLRIYLKDLHTVYNKFLKLVNENESLFQALSSNNKDDILFGEGIAKDKFNNQRDLLFLFPEQVWEEPNSNPNFSWPMNHGTHLLHNIKSIWNNYNSQPQKWETHRDQLLNEKSKY